MRSIRVVGSVATAVVVIGAVVAGLGLTGHLPALTSEGRARAALDNALTELALSSPDFSVAVLDKAGDKNFSYRGDDKFSTASAVKVSVLACTLLQAQDRKRELTAAQKSLAGRMIRASDNDATTALFDALGGAAGLTACDKRLGMTATTVDKAWGLTRTTADDQVRLLGNLVSDDSELAVDARQYVFDLMGSVNDDQNWGVPSVARDGETAPVKNGWDTSTADGGLWIVNTVGRIVSADRSTNVSIAVLSHGSKTREDGIALVEKVAALTRENLKY
ncbi:MAG: serine hydrolase [Actinoplanes sp.]